MSLNEMDLILDYPLDELLLNPTPDPVTLDDTNLDPAIHQKNYRVKVPPELYRRVTNAGRTPFKEGLKQLLEINDLLKGT